MDSSTKDFFVKLSERATNSPKELMDELIALSKTAPGQVQGMLASIANSHTEFVKEVSSKL